MIGHRVADFLKQFPPFSFLSKEVLEKVAASVEIRYLEEGELFLDRDKLPKLNFIFKKKGQLF